MQDKVIGPHHPEWRYQAPRTNSLKLKAGMESIRAVMGNKMNTAHLFLSAPSAGHLQPGQIIYYLIQINCHVFLPSCSPRVIEDLSASKVAQLSFDQQTSQWELSRLLLLRVRPRLSSLKNLAQVFRPFAPNFSSWEDRNICCSSCLWSSW